jgi:hypothetical protein
MNPKRVAAFIGVASLTALTSACSVVPHRPPPMPVRYDLAPAYYYDGYAQRPYQPPQTYAANNRVPVAPSPPPSCGVRRDVR